jgi:hypothetical protein
MTVFSAVRCTDQADSCFRVRSILAVGDEWRYAFRRVPAVCGVGVAMIGKRSRDALFS